MFILKSIHKKIVIQLENKIRDLENKIRDLEDDLELRLFEIVLEDGEIIKVVGTCVDTKNLTNVTIKNNLTVYWDTRKPKIIKVLEFLSPDTKLKPGIIR